MTTFYVLNDDDTFFAATQDLLTALDIMRLQRNRYVEREDGVLMSKMRTSQRVCPPDENRLQPEERPTMSEYVFGMARANRGKVKR